MPFHTNPETPTVGQDSNTETMTTTPDPPPNPVETTIQIGREATQGIIIPGTARLFELSDDDQTAPPSSVYFSSR